MKGGLDPKKDLLNLALKYNVCSTFSTQINARLIIFSLVHKRTFGIN